MSPVLGKGLIIGAVAAAGGTGIWYWGGDLFGSGAEFVSHESASKGQDQSQKPSTNSLGAKYGKYLLSSGHNSKIWNRIYDKYKDSSFKSGDANQSKDKFKSVNSAYSTDNDNTTALNKVCEEAYKVTSSSNLAEDDASDASEKYSKPNIWKFCTLGVTTLQDASETFTVAGDNASSKTAIGSDTNSKKLLVSAKEETTGNDWFWKIRSEEFWQASGARSGASSQSPTQGDSNNSVFKTLFGDTEKKKAKKNIRSKCQEAYSLESDDSDTKKNKADAELFCSIKLDLA